MDRRESMGEVEIYSKLRSGGFSSDGCTRGGTKTPFFVTFKMGVNEFLVTVNDPLFPSKIYDFGGFRVGDFSIVVLMLFHLTGAVLVSLPVWVSCTVDVGNIGKRCHHSGLKYHIRTVVKVSQLGSG